LYHESNGINLPHAIAIVGASSTYDTGMIWRNIARSTKPRDLSVKAGLARRLSDDAPEPTRTPDNTAQPIAALVHVTDVELLPEILERITLLPAASDLIVTTDAGEKRAQIETLLAGMRHSGSSVVRVTERTAGRDASAMLITCRDLFLADRYDVVCK